jgi:hypothetical protein
LFLCMLDFFYPHTISWIVFLMIICRWCFQVIAVAKSSDLVLMVLDASKVNIWLKNLCFTSVVIFILPLEVRTAKFSKHIKILY